MKDTVECPYCHQENDMSDGLTDLPADNRFDHECDECEREFEVEVEFEPYYSASKITSAKCDVCGEQTRDAHKAGGTFPWPNPRWNILCSACYWLGQSNNSTNCAGR